MTKESSVQHAPKVGRHRVYSNEQRKDRNRQAQAAFRDRRSKYTQTLENAIVNFEETIKNLKESNDQTMKRAQAAEERSHHLASEVESLQRLLGMALADNQRLQAQVTLSNDMLPLSPNSDNLAPDKMPLVDPMLQLFDANPTMAATTTSSSSPMSSAASHDQQFDLFNAAMLTGESHKLAAVL
ncbi:basic-leucine zipper transcription factor [Mucor lusitanicus]|uniref:Basic-leucine zipper transcription factor n=1 Tax=Mucor lusitanicus CBS 277.49 TaxID=747725 RepID=A0A168PT27_MUCCL|nr:basic-leucine zipper transcription factor [Mucor lusitanicus CBS 277.49]